MARPFRKPRLPTDNGEAPQFKEFAGIINTRSRKDIGMGGLRVGKNVFVSDSKKVTRVSGYELVYPGNVLSAFGGMAGLYVVEDDAILLAPEGDVANAATVATGMIGTKYVWDEVNGDVFFVNGVDAGLLRGAAMLPLRLTAPVITSVEVVSVGTRATTPVNIGASYDEATWRFCATFVTADGRETAPSEVVSIIASPLANLFRVTVPPAYEFTNIYVTQPDGTEYRRVVTTRDSVVSIAPAQRSEQLTSVGTYAMPAGIECIVWCDGQLWGSLYVPHLKQSVIWASDPFAYHLWRPASEGIAVSGRVSMMQRAKEGMVIGTTHWVYHLSGGEKLTTLAEYGVVPGQAGDVTAEGDVYFWTTRGFCKAMPFENLTEANLSVPPGGVAYSKILYLNGSMLCVALTDGGGQAFNQRTERE